MKKFTKTKCAPPNTVVWSPLRGASPPPLGHGSRIASPLKASARLTAGAAGASGTAASASAVGAAAAAAPRVLRTRRAAGAVLRGVVGRACRSSGSGEP